LLTTFYDFLIRHFKKNVKSHVFLKSEKNIKYVFSNTVQDFLTRLAADQIANQAQCLLLFKQIVVGLYLPAF